MPKIPPFSKAAPLHAMAPKKAPATRAATCGCLCGESVGPNSTFRQGHDQRMVGELALLVVEGTIPQVWIDKLVVDDTVNEGDIQQRISYVADRVARTFSGPLADKFNRAAVRRWQKAGAEQQSQTNPADLLEEVERGPEDKKDQQVLDLSVVAEQEYEIAPGAPVRVKVGRWEYDATVHGMNQAGKVTAVRYYNKNEREIVKTENEFILI